MVPLKAAAMDLGLAKDILCAEPWWSRNPAPNMITVHSPEQMLDALVDSAFLSTGCHINGRWVHRCAAKCGKSVGGDRLLCKVVSILSSALPQSA